MKVLVVIPDLKNVNVILVVTSQHPGKGDNPTRISIGCVFKYFLFSLLFGEDFQFD